MASKLRRAIGAVKDQTSIGLAKVSSRANGSSNLEVAILKATSHDQVPIDERLITEVLLLTKSSPLSAVACVQTLSRRLTRTGNWVVALKSLTLAFGALRDAGPDFSREALSVLPRRRRLLDLSTFCDDSSWDFTAFVRTYALYLDARLDSALLGKLGNLHHRRRLSSTNNRIANMKLPLILDRIAHWQRLLARAVATRPTGPARTNRLVQISLYDVVRESFDLYHDISDGLSLLLDNFFHLELPACRETFRACTKAAKQFEELDSFYSICKKVGIGRSSEYPSVRMISKGLLRTLEEFLKDHENSSSNGKLRSPPKLSIPAPRRQNSDVRDRIPVTPKPGRQSICSTTDWELLNSDQEWLSEEQARPRLAGNQKSIGGSSGTLSDLLSFDDELRSSVASNSDRENGVVLDLVSFDYQPTKSTVSNSDRQNGMVRDLVLFDNQPKASTASNSARESGVVLDPVPFDNQSKASTTTSSSDRENGVVLDLVPFDNQSKASTSPNSDSWELVLVDTANRMSDRVSGNSIKGPKNLKLDSLLDNGSFRQFPLNYYNPFLHDFNEKNLAIVPSPRSSLPSPTIHAARPNEDSAKEGADPFAWSPQIYSPALTQTLDVSAMQQQQQLLSEQQMWMQYQRKIIAKNLER
ncbi:clathrin coat assembly protein AP180 [Cocos nucifera]|uniref:Clathrin coat assembly protein AP180 n=1 Tax=Cocos nucifera TaxID=13894 RepID=A0A8K0I1U4_COCNU|nr:clathrin coat assembly protein AP180 [Cocos nucifera]